jgi:hypothetical protein
MLLLALALILFGAQLTEARTDLQTSADAAALAAVQVFVDDRVLIGKREDMLELIANAGAEAWAYAQVNPVLGQPLVLFPNPTNDPAGDLVFGWVNRPRDRELLAVDLSDPSVPLAQLINTVRLTARCTQGRGTEVQANGGPLLSPTSVDAFIFATATLDRDVIGFRHVCHRPIRLAPIALFSDPTGASQQSWQYQVEGPNGTDLWSFDRVLKQFTPGSDGLREMTVILAQGPGQGTGQTLSPSVGGTGSSSNTSNACVLQFGTGNLTDVANQVITGVTREQLSLFGGELVLGPTNNLLEVPGSPWLPTGGGQGTSSLQQALGWLQQQAEPRIWPLYQGLDPETAMPILSGFVAARVASLPPTQSVGNLSFVLQPCMVAAPEAVTDANRRGVGGVAITNRYICKVRLVE